MKKCSSFSQNKKRLVVIVVRDAFFVAEEVLSYCQNTSRIGLR